MSAFLFVDMGEPGKAICLCVSDGIGRIVREVLLSTLIILGLYCFYRRLIRLTSRWKDCPVSKGPGSTEEFFRVFEITLPMGGFLFDELSFSWNNISLVPEPFFAKPILLKE